MKLTTVLSTLLLSYKAASESTPTPHNFDCANLAAHASEYGLDAATAAADLVASGFTVKDLESQCSSADFNILAGNARGPCSQEACNKCWAICAGTSWIPLAFPICVAVCQNTDCKPCPHSIVRAARPVMHPFNCTGLMVEEKEPGFNLTAAALDLVKSGVTAQDVVDQCNEEATKSFGVADSLVGGKPKPKSGGKVKPCDQQACTGCIETCNAATKVMNQEWILCFIKCWDQNSGGCKLCPE